MTEDAITLLHNAVTARNTSLNKLRKRIATLLAPIPVGTILHEENGAVLIDVRPIFTGASQWANTTWEVTIEGVGYLSAGGAPQLIAAQCDQSKHDGSNMHHRTTEPYLLARPDWSDPDSDSHPRNGLQWASGVRTRDVATKLPAAIAKYLEECKNEQEANDAMLLEPAAQVQAE